ncbi:MAG: flagellar hook-length control protein FliK [Lachnospiraceae bacterium]|nr:flagellar hook-length control protein FliK [Lachnospiraceae bacterium]
MSVQWSNYGTYTRTTGVNAANTQSVTVPPSANNNALLRGMTPGETLQGEIVSVKGNEAEIRIGENSVITARLGGDMDIGVGQKIYFEVQNGGSGQIALRALFTNLTGEGLTGTALEAANLPVNSTSVALVEQLMQQGMSIDKNALQGLYRDAVQFPEASPAELVMMHKMGLEATPSNVQQFQALCNYEERLATTLQDIMDALPGEISSLAAKGDGEQAMALSRDVIQFIAEYEMAQSGKNTMVSQTAEGVVAPEQPSLQEMPDGQGKTVVTENGLPVTAEGADGEGAVRQVIQENDRVLMELVGKNGEVTENSGQNAFTGILTGEELARFTSLLEGQKGFESILAGIKDGSLEVGEFFKLLGQQLSDNQIGQDAVMKLFEDKGFSKLVGKELQQAWLLSPGEVEKGENISDFYTRLNRQVQTIADSMAKSFAASDALSQNISQFKENVDFLNQLNQLVPYVQLPLKMNGQSATGDLYVFADKKSLAEKTENITASLHLDMQYLGHVDVFVTLNNSKVSTEFKVQDEATLDFLMNHIDILNERLQKRGYDMKAEVKIAPGPGSVKTDLFPEPVDESREKDKMIETLRFDVRA